MTNVRMKIESFDIAEDENGYSKEINKREWLDVSVSIEEARKLMAILQTLFEPIVIDPKDYEVIK